MKSIESTIELMLSSDYKERFKAEYEQTRIRYLKLKAIVTKYYQGTLEFELSCPIDILMDQLDIMQSYIDILEIRATIENVEL